MFCVFFYTGNDRISGVPKAAKNNQNCTSSECDVSLLVVYKQGLTSVNI